MENRNRNRNRNWDRVVYRLLPPNELTFSSMYGSMISRSEPDGGLHYVNPLVTPGRTLMQWQSCPDRNNLCSQPELPLPPRGQEVRVYPFWRTSIPGSYSLQAEYLDKKRQVIGLQRLDFASIFGGKNCADSTAECGTNLLQIPEEAYHWRLRFIQSGEGELWFHHIALVLLQDEEAWDRETVYHPVKEDNCCRILLPDLSGRTNRLPDPERVVISDLSGVSSYPADCRKLSSVLNLRTMPLLLASAAAIVDPFPVDAYQQGNEDSKWVRNKVREFLETVSGEYGTVEFLACGPTSVQTVQRVQEISKTV